MDITEKLADLERQARQLEPSPEDRTKLQQLTLEYSNRFYESHTTQKAYTAFDHSVYHILEDEIDEEPAAPETTLRFFENKVVPPGLNVGSGRNFGYIPGGDLSAAAAGDYLAAVTNRYSSVFSSSPGAALLETRLVNWMIDLAGYGINAGGYLASGGSIANLTAIVTARDGAGLDPGSFKKAVVYLTGQTHHCVDRALNIAGLKSCHRRYIPMDSQFRMKPGALKKQIGTDKTSGLIPWLVVASAGSTDTGAIDPLDEIGAIAGEYSLWFHVDAAYGGFFLLTGEGRKKLKGMELSDSLVLDPHKGLFLPYGIGALLVKDVEKLAGAHSYQANYMKHAAARTEYYSPADISPELSKHFRAVRMWLPLKIHGLKAFRSSLEEKLLLAKYLWRNLNAMDEIEVSPQPQLTVFMFRWVPEGKDPEEMNRKLHKAILNDGRIFLSTTEVGGKFYFRVAVLACRTHLEHADALIHTLKELTGNLSQVSE